MSKKKKKDLWLCAEGEHWVKSKYGYCNKCSPELKCLDVDALCRFRGAPGYNWVPENGLCYRAVEIRKSWSNPLHGVK